MNIIKFLAFDETKNEIAKVKAIDWGANDIIVSCHLEYEDGTVAKKYPEKDYGDQIYFMQFANIKDINDKEIYNGHILKGPFGEIVVCEFHRTWGAFYFSLRLSYDEYNVLCEATGSNPIWNDANKYEVIGNIYQNPELIQLKHYKK